MVLIPGIDEKQTKCNARKLLSTYRSKMRRLAGGFLIDPYSLVNSPEITDDPIHRSNVNGVEKQVLFHLRKVSLAEDRSGELAAMDSALNALSEVSQQILRYSYCCADKYSVRDIAYKLCIYKADEMGRHEKIYYSEKNIERLKGQALIEFADAYNGGELIAHEK